jgi:hypothetical protein
MCVATEARSDVEQTGRLQRIEPAERKVRHIGDAVAGKIVDQDVGGPRLLPMS